MQNKRGGKRIGAGRKKLPYKTKQIKITIPESMAKLFKKLGGSKWVKNLLEAHNENI